jgi:hypothetical protein
MVVQNCGYRRHQDPGALNLSVNRRLVCTGLLKGIINFDNIFELLRIQAVTKDNDAASRQLRM